MRTNKYPSDVTDDQWHVIRPLFPKRRWNRPGRPRTVAPRDIVDAIFYILRTGCQWRLLAHDFPPLGHGFFPVLPLAQPRLVGTHSSHPAWPGARGSWESPRPTAAIITSQNADRDATADADSRMRHPAAARLLRTVPRRHRPSRQMYWLEQWPAASMFLQGGPSDRFHEVSVELASFVLLRSSFP